MEHNIEYGEVGERSQASEILMPQGTLWPMLLALGLMLTFAGYIFHPYLSYAGIVLVLAAAGGWCTRVIPEEAHEYVPLSVTRRPSGVEVKASAVARLSVGRGQHRMHVPVEAHPYSSGLLGGLAGAVVMAGLACLYGLFAQHSIWYPVNLLAGVVMPGIGSETMNQLRMFNPFAFGAAVTGHVILSVLVGVLYAVMLPMFPRFAFYWAGILVPLLWTALVATVLQLVNPALNARISWPWFVACQFGFALVCGYVIARSERIQTMQSWSLAERAHVHAPGMSGQDAVQ